MNFLAKLFGRNALVLKEKEINPEGPLYVHLAGRKSGLIDWFLTILKINTTTTLDVYEDRIEYKSGSLSGEIYDIMPFANISNLQCGRFRPVIFFILGVISFIWSNVMITKAVDYSNSARSFYDNYGNYNENYQTFLGILAFILIIAAVVFFFLYYLKKSTVISVITNSSSSSGIAVKRSVIENKNISEKEAVEIIQLITKLVCKANK